MRFLQLGASWGQGRHGSSGVVVKPFIKFGEIIHGSWCIEDQKSSLAVQAIWWWKHLLKMLWVFLSTFPKTPKLNNIFFATEWAHTIQSRTAFHPISHLMSEPLNTRLWGCSCTWRFGRYETGRMFFSIYGETARLVFTAFEWTQTKVFCCLQGTSIAAPVVSATVPTAKAAPVQVPELVTEGFS